MQESKVFIGGGLDSDTATEYVANVDYRDAIGIRIITSDGQSDGYVTGVTGNELIPHNLPTGTNKGIGAAFFDVIRKGYIFIANSNNNHQIVEVDYDLETATVIYENLIDSSDNALQLTLNGYVKDIKLIDNKHLYFLDTQGKPCTINIDRLKNDSYGTAVNSFDFDLIKRPPTLPVGGAAETATYWYYQGDEQVFVDYNVNGYFTDDTFPTNFLFNKTFQFRYQYVYLDNETSSKSIISKRFLPDPEEGDIFDIGKNNVIRLSIQFPSARVKEIIISVRQDNQDWQVWKTVTREEASALPRISRTNASITSLLPIGEDFMFSVFIGGTPTTYVTYFYNDGVYPPDDVLENDLLFDWVPKQAGALEVLNGKYLALGDLWEGYDKPVVPEDGITLSKNTYDIEIQGSSVFRVISYTSSSPLTNPDLCAALFVGEPKAGDKVIIEFTDGDTPPVPYTYEYTVPSDASLVTVINDLVTYLNSQTPPSPPPPAPSVYSGSIDALAYTASNGRWLSFNSFTTSGAAPTDYWMKLAYISVVTQGTDIGSVQRILKKGSSYQLALSHKDVYGRAFPLITGESFIINTNPDSTDLHIDQAEEINWVINMSPPEGATSYQWLLSENRSHQNWRSVPARLLKDESGGSSWTWDVTSLLDFVTDNNGTIISYDYAQGDMARMVYRMGSPETQIQTYFNLSENKTMQIRSFEPKYNEDGETIQYILKTTPPVGVEMSVIPDNANVLLELFTPKSSIENNLFYEIGDTYPITNGEYTVTSGTIREGDSFVKFRNYDWVGADDIVLWMLESQHISDFKVSNFHNYGMPRSEGDVPENIHSPANIRYSEVYRRRSKINLLNRFYAENLYEDLNEDYGSIRNMSLRDDYLIVIQELKLAYVPVNRQILEDLEQQQNVAVSNVLLNTSRYSKGDNYGIGNRQMSLSTKKSSFYFVDPNNYKVVRAGLDGVKPISGKYSKKIREFIQNGGECVGYYDNLNEEYVVRLGADTIAFSELNDKWQSKHPYLPEIGCTAMDKMITTNNGQIFVHKATSAKNNFYGVYTKPEIVIVANSNPAITKNWQSISLQSDNLLITTIDGVETSLSQLSDLLAEDFELYTVGAATIYDREGNYYANFLRAKPDIINGDRLKGNWITLRLTLDTETDFKLFRVGIDYQPSLVTP